MQPTQIRRTFAANDEFEVTKSSQKNILYELNA